MLWAVDTIENCKDTKNCPKSADAMIYYYTTTTEKHKTSFLKNKGAIQYEIIQKEVLVKWGKMYQADDSRNILKADANYTLFITNNVIDYNNMESICYLSKMYGDNSYQIVYGDHNASVKNLKEGGKYFINVLAQNLENMELFSYRPIEVTFVGVGGFPIWMIGIKYFFNFKSVL